MLIVIVFFLLMYVSIVMVEKVRNPGYSCPACGTRRQDEHSPDCSWSRHYGDDL